MDDTLGDGKADVFKYEIAPTTRKTLVMLKSITTRDEYIGCVYSKKFPVRGFEGRVILASKVELLGVIDRRSSNIDNSGLHKNPYVGQPIDNGGLTK